MFALAVEALIPRSKRAPTTDHRLPYFHGFEQKMLGAFLYVFP